MATDPVQQALAPEGPVPEGRLQLALAPIDQVEANMVERLARPPWPRSRHLDRSPRHLDLVGVRSPGDHLDRPAIPVTGRKILARIDPRRVLAENRLHMARLLEKRIPVDGREQTQAEHAIADRDLIGGLAALFAAEDFVRVRAPLAQLVFEMLEGLDPAALIAE